MTPGLLRFALTTHVVSSVGWLGAVAGFLAMSIAGVGGPDAQTVRAAYIAMHLITWWVIVPFSVAALATGLVQSLGTPWGLFRHYWVVAKLALTVVATVVLLVHTQPIAQVAALAADTTLSTSDLREIRIRLIADAAAALLALVVATTLSVYKPWGMTTYGRRATGVAGTLEVRSTPSAFRRWMWIAAALAAVGIFLLLHLTGGMSHLH